VGRLDSVKGVTPVSDLRQQILDASVALIEAEGLGALSLREVARRAGVSHQAPYHYFADRAAILAAVAQVGFERLRDALREAHTGPGDAVARLERGGRAYVAFARAHPGYFRVMFRPELVDLSQHPEAVAAADEARALLDALVQALVDEGRLAPDDVTGMVTLAWSFVHGLASLVLDGPLAHTSEVATEVQLEAAFRVYTALVAGAPKSARAPRKRRSAKAR
jgi:AcrR family transcriptional regulator